MKLQAKNIRHIGNQILIEDQNSETHVIPDVSYEAGKYTETEWMFEDAVVEQFDEDSKLEILATLNKTHDGNYFA